MSKNQLASLGTLLIVTVLGWVVAFNAAIASEFVSCQFEAQIRSVQQLERLGNRATSANPPTTHDQIIEIALDRLSISRGFGGCDSLVNSTHKLSVAAPKSRLFSVGDVVNIRYQRRGLEDLTQIVGWFLLDEGGKPVDEQRHDFAQLIAAADNVSASFLIEHPNSNRAGCFAFGVYQERLYQFQLKYDPTITNPFLLAALDNAAESAEKIVQHCFGESDGKVLEASKRLAATLRAATKP